MELQGRGAADPPGLHRVNARAGRGRRRICAMRIICSQTFVVVEGSTVVGSFVSLRDALEFRGKSGSRSARIFADHGEFDRVRFHGVKTRTLWVPQPAGSS